MKCFLNGIAKHIFFKRVRDAAMLWKNGTLFIGIALHLFYQFHHVNWLILSIRFCFKDTIIIKYIVTFVRDMPLNIPFYVKLECDYLYCG